MLNEQYVSLLSVLPDGEYLASDLPILMEQWKSGLSVAVPPQPGSPRPERVIGNTSNDRLQPTIINMPCWIVVQNGEFAGIRLPTGELLTNWKAEDAK